MPSGIATGQHGIRGFNRRHRLRIVIACKNHLLQPTTQQTTQKTPRKEKVLVNRQYLKLLLVILMLLLPALACGGGEEAAPTLAPETKAPETATPEPSAGIQVLEATFAHGLSEEMRPLNPGADFAPDETIYLSIKVKGRPKEGVVTARFYWKDQFIAEANVDLADVNSGVIFSVGENTYLGYTLSHEKPCPVGEDYHAEVFYGDQPLGTYPFRVVETAEAISSQIKEVVLARGADEKYNPVEPTTTFAPDEAVYMVGRGDLGTGTQLRTEWYVSGQLDEDGSRTLDIDQNLANVGFSFSFLPAGGWPTGEHRVALIMNGAEVGRYSFTVAQ
jgi:hypothetical protein